MDEFTAAYVECALWSSLDEHGEPLDSVLGIDDVAPDALATMTADCAEFQEANADMLRAATESRASYTLARAGHDFWLTRNGHGAGFWDRGLGAIGAALTAAAKAHGSCDLYCDESDRIHVA